VGEKGFLNRKKQKCRKRSTFLTTICQKVIAECIIEPIARGFLDSGFSKVNERKKGLRKEADGDVSLLRSLCPPNTRN